MEFIQNQNEQHILEKIKAEYENMTRSQKKIADYILENPSGMIKATITDLCTLTGIKSEASVVRFYRTLGYAGFKDFKIQLAQELVGQTFYHSYEDIRTDDPVAVIRRKIFSGAIATLTTNANYPNDEIYEKARDLLLCANRIVLMGYAASAAVCYYAYFRFTEIGLNCHFSSDSHMNAAVLAQPSPNDLVFCVSHSGESRDLIVPLEKITHKEVSVVLVTGSENSTLAKMADVALVTKSDEGNIITDAMNSRVAEMCIIDSLFSIIGISKGKDAMARLLATRRTFYDYKK